MEAIPANSLVPFVTLAAALIAGFFSYLNLVIAKEQKVSEFRQAWIDKLREDISQYVAAISYLASVNEVWIEEGRKNRLDHFKAMQTSYDAAGRPYISILLRINPLDSDAKMREPNEAFLTTLQSVRDAVRREDTQVARNLSDTLSELAQPILKHEWQRVKDGERIYRLTRYVTATVIVIALFFGIVLAYRIYHPRPVVSGSQQIKRVM